MRKLLRLVDIFRCFFLSRLFAYGAFSLLCFCFFFSVCDFSLAQSRDVEAIFFESNANSISRESKELINKKVEVLNNTPLFTITLEGYSDITGRADYNLELSGKRAQLVKDYLTGLGVDADRIKVVGKGGTEKYGAGETNEALQQNRRVNLIIDIPAEPKREETQEESEEASPPSAPDPAVEQGEETPPADSPSEAEPAPEPENIRVSAALPTPEDLSQIIENNVRERPDGSIIFNTPTQTHMGESYSVEAILARTFVEALSKDLGGIRLDNAVSLELAGQGFDVAKELEAGQGEGAESENGAQTRQKDGDFPLTWKWLVTPQRDGIGSLVLSIAIAVDNPEDGSISSEYAAFYRIVEVRPNIIHTITSSYWIMGFLIILIIALVARILIRQVRAD